MMMNPDADAPNYDADVPTYERDDHGKLIVIYYSRKKFYNGRDIYWYEFLNEYGQNIMTYCVNIGKFHRFLRVPETKYYEFGGSHEEAIKCLIERGVESIIEGHEL